MKLFEVQIPPFQQINTISHNLDQGKPSKTTFNNEKIHAYLTALNEASINNYHATVAMNIRLQNIEKSLTTAH